MGFWGELYVRSTDPILEKLSRRTTLEVGYLGWAFSTLQTAGPLLDLGCGTGRHITRLAALTRRSVVGLDFDAYSLAHRLPGVRAVRADLLAVPLAPNVLAGAYAWYSALFSFEEEQLSHILRSLVPAFRKGGRLVLQTWAIESRKVSPTEDFQITLEDGSHITDSARYDPSTQREHFRRTMRFPDGRMLDSGFFLQHYTADQLCAVVEAAGYEIRFVHSDLARSPPGAITEDLIVGAEVRDG